MEQKNKRTSRNISEKEMINRYLKFVVFFNRFINHRKKTRRNFIERDMRM